MDIGMEIEIPAGDEESEPNSPVLIEDSDVEDIIENQHSDQDIYDEDTDIGSVASSPGVSMELRPDESMRPNTPGGESTASEQGSRPATPVPVIQNESLHDFKSPVKRRPPSPKKPATPAKHNTSAADEDAECCPICFECWTNSGNHRLVSLKCGHLFGQSCIEKWLKGQGGKCPHCNSKAHRKDIRVIYAKALKLTDTSERDRALEELEKEKVERRKVEMEASQVRLRYQMAIDECNRLKQELEQQRSRAEIYGVAGPSSQHAGPSSSPFKATQNSQSKDGSFILEKVIKIWEAGGCRVIANCHQMATLCVAQPSASPIFPGFGIKKISTLDMKTSQYVSVHTKQIRDLAFQSGGNDTLMLSASMDATVKLTSLVTNTVVQSYTTRMPVWCCTWNHDDKNYFYAGQQNGCVYVFDTRNTSQHVNMLNTEGSRSPCVSLQYAPQKPNSLFGPGGLIVGQLDRSTFFEKKGDTYQMHALQLQNSLTSLSLEENTRHVLATYRPSAKFNTVRHQMCELTCRNLSRNPTVIENVVSANCIHTFHGGSTQKMLSRSKLILHPSGNGNLLVCAGDEASSSLHIWDAVTGGLKQKLPCALPVIDLCPFYVQDQFYLAALNEKHVMILKWTERT